MSLEGKLRILPSRRMLANSLDRSVIKEDLLECSANSVAECSDSLIAGKEFWFVYGVVGKVYPIMEGYRQQLEMLTGCALFRLDLSRCTEVSVLKDLDGHAQRLRIVLEEEFVELVTKPRFLYKLRDWEKTLKQHLVKLQILDDQDEHNYVKDPLIGSKMKAKPTETEEIPYHPPPPPLAPLAVTPPSREILLPPPPSREILLPPPPSRAVLSQFLEGTRNVSERSHFNSLHTTRSPTSKYVNNISLRSGAATLSSRYHKYLAAQTAEPIEQPNAELHSRSTTQNMQRSHRKHSGQRNELLNSQVEEGAHSTSPEDAKTPPKESVWTTNTLSSKLRTLAARTNRPDMPPYPSNLKHQSTLESSPLSSDSSPTSATRGRLLSSSSTEDFESIESWTSPPLDGVTEGASAGTKFKKRTMQENWSTTKSKGETNKRPTENGTKHGDEENFMSSIQPYMMSNQQFNRIDLSQVTANKVKSLITYFDHFDKSRYICYDFKENFNEPLASFDNSTYVPLPAAVPLDGKRLSKQPDSVVHVGSRKSLIVRQAEVLQREIEHPAGVRVSVKRRHCYKNILFVDCDKSVRVAGVNLKACPGLSSAFHVGDVLLSLNDCKVASSSAVGKTVKRSAKDAQLSFLLRRIPRGTVHVLTRHDEREKLGLIRLDGTNQLYGVAADSTASRAGVAESMRESTRWSTEKHGKVAHPANWTITEVNHQPLNIFNQSNQINARLNAAGKELSIVLQPTEVLQQLQQAMKLVKHYKNFIFE